MNSCPWSAVDWLNAGGKLTEHNPVLAQRLLKRGLLTLPDTGIGLYNLGISLHQQGRPAAAARAYSLALQQADSPGAQGHRNLALDLLLAGQFNEGWLRYEQRLERMNHRFFAQWMGVRWQGPSLHPPEQIHQLVLVSEQGFGDTLQFCRYALVLQQLGYEVKLFCQRQLTALLREGSGIGHVSDAMDAAEDPAHTAWVPLMSVPGLLNTHNGNVPLAEGYLRVDPIRVEHWKQQLQRQPGKRLVALHWQGNPGSEGSCYSRGRSMALSHWAPLMQVPDLEVVAIQKGDALAQRQQLPLPWVRGQAAVEASMDFRDTAAVLKHCDLLISADSAVVHLAGAMAVPTWVALKRVPEWRWGLSEHMTPWYHSLRLFRQQQADHWGSVVWSICRALGTQ
jgi:hypothetical protein